MKSLAAYCLVTALTNALFCCVSIETKFAFARVTSIPISADGIFDAVVSTSLTLVNVGTPLPIPSETFSTSTHVRPAGVNTFNSIVSEDAAILASTIASKTKLAFANVRTHGVYAICM